MKYESEDSINKAVYIVAELMALAAKTAPKSFAADNVVTLLLDGEEEKNMLSAEMKKVGEDVGSLYFQRDGDTIKDSDLLFLIGVKEKPLGNKACGYCGFTNCDEMKGAGGRCAVNFVNLGIAIGSAVSVAADHRVDNRVMFTVGRAALNLKLFPEDVRACYGILLATKAKNILFDRALETNSSR